MTSDAVGGTEIRVNDPLPFGIDDAGSRHGAWRGRLAACLAIALFCAAPVVIFQATMRDAATEFRLEFNYLVTGWGPWALIALGSLCFVPVAASIGRDVYSRWFLSARIRHIWEIWGAVLYLLGVVLLTQTSQIADAF
jgi:hypothetical protein